MISIKRFIDRTTIGEKYRRLSEGVTDYAIYTLTPEGIVSSWNAGAQRCTGYVAQEILGQHFSCFYTPDDRSMGLPQLALDTALKSRFEAEGWRVRKDGTRFWAHVVINPIRKRSGELAGFAEISRDITERRLADEALRQSEQQFRILVQGVNDYAIFLVDLSGIITTWNNGAERIKGYGASEIIGKHVACFYSDADQRSGEPQKLLDTAARSGRSEAEGWRVRKDGTQFWANVVVDAIRGPDGDVVGFAKITRDITERRKADQTRQALVQAQKMEALGQLTGGVAHDFNNVLAAILGGLELVRAHLPDDLFVTPLLDNAIKGAQRGRALTKRMLTFARRDGIQVEPVDIAGLLQGMSDLIAHSLQDQVTIEARFPLTLSKVEADPNQLELALLNLLLNARDAMPNGGVIILGARVERVIGSSVQDGLTPGEYVCLTVADTGEGMESDVLLRAIEPFYTTKDLGKGTGLGLSMVHGLALQLRGKLVLKSQLGSGTTAELWLPSAKKAITFEIQREVASFPLTKTKSALSILVVDDDNLVLMNTMMMLFNLGFVGIAASSGKYALDIVVRTPSLDLLITDQRMPYMTGLELASAVKTARPNLPIILATGYSKVSLSEMPNLYKLEKPFSQADLKKAINFVVQPRGDLVGFAIT